MSIIQPSAMYIQSPDLLSVHRRLLSFRPRPTTSWSALRRPFHSVPWPLAVSFALDRLLSFRPLTAGVPFHSPTSAFIPSLAACVLHCPPSSRRITVRRTPSGAWRHMRPSARWSAGRGCRRRGRCGECWRRPRRTAVEGGAVAARHVRLNSGDLSARRLVAVGWSMDLCFPKAEA